MSSVTEVAEGFRVLYQDEALCLVDKPSGIVVHRGWADDEGGVLMGLRRQLGRHVWPVHRLDRGASGVLAFALTAEVAAVMGRMFGGHEVQKRYLAIVRGHPPEQVVVDHPLANKEGGEKVPASTEVRRLAVWERYALVEARPRTGRLHQVRRHLKHLSCPIIGDVNYGKGEHNRLFRERFGLHRLALHALSLRFLHPAAAGQDQQLLDGWLEVRSPPSGQLFACLATMGLAPVIEDLVKS